MASTEFQGVYTISRSSCVCVRMFVLCLLVFIKLFPVNKVISAQIGRGFVTENNCRNAVRNSHISMKYLFGLIDHGAVELLNSTILPIRFQLRDEFVNLQLLIHLSQSIVSETFSDNFVTYKRSFM